MYRLIITLDGPAGSGKSTVARRLANRLGLQFLDCGIDPSHEDEAVVELARNCEMSFDWGRDPPQLRVGGADVTSRLRDRDVTQHASSVAAILGVRQVLVEAQQRIGREHAPLVSEGRDQGSVVFPHADLKFYLDAIPAVRAQRRAEQIRQAGRHADLDQIRVDILARDRQDSSRKHAPLICPLDAQQIDTSELTLDEVVHLLEARVREHLRVKK